MMCTWEDRKQRGSIDGQPLNDKPALSFEYAWFLVTDETAQYVESHDYGYWNKDMTEAQRQEVVNFYYAWEPPAPEPLTLDDMKEAKRQELDQARDAAFEAGMPYQFSDGEDVVQTRTQDQINLMGLAAKAQRQLEAGDDTPMPFRALSNQTRMLTPAETDAMALAALAHIEGIYARTWQAKDAIDAAETVEEVEAIAW